MQFDSLIGHTYEILKLTYLELKKSHGIPPDSMLDLFFRGKKYLGSNDRRFIAENVYNSIRFFHKRIKIIEETVKYFPFSLSDDEKLFFVLILNFQDENLSIRSLIEISNYFIQNKRLTPYLSQIIPVLFESSINIEFDLIKSLAFEYSFLEWVIKKLIMQFGEDETRQLCESLNKQAPINIRVNTLKTTVEECQKRLELDGVETYRTDYAPYGLKLTKRINVFTLKAFREGLFEVQDEGSQLLVHLTDPKPTYKILDACAGAGGKSLAFSSIMKNRGELYATDINLVRLNKLKKRARRAGAHNIRIKHVKSLKLLQREFESFFDIVFVDSPCTGLGTLRRNPGFKISVTEKTLRDIIKRQELILKQVAPLVKVNGLMVYATCSILIEENENQVEKFLNSHENFELTFAPNSELANKLKINGPWYKILPHKHHTDGFFCAFMKRIFY